MNMSGKIKTLITTLISITFAFIAITPALAEEKLITDLGSRYEYYRVSYELHENYNYEEVREWAVKVLHERAIKDLKSTTVNYSTSVQKIEIMSAYNKKADGTRVDAPKTNYQVNTNSGRNKNDPVFSDYENITTVFPDVQVGDTLVFSYKLTTTEPMFPGYFATAMNFYENIAYDNALIKIVTPASIKAHYKSNKMIEKISTENNKTTYEWSFINQSPKQDTREDYSVWDRETYPGFLFSTFDSYQAIAEAYGKRALPKATVTDQVKKLAADIIGKETDTKAKTRLLYEWVATNITYAGNCVGIGAVVPHDISFILDNKMGDCKDHATLLQALLASQNIRSTQALINASSVYKLPSIPMVSSVNHVINYLPDVDLFLDSTSPSTPFEMLPQNVQGKPALLVENFKPDMKTPTAPIGSNKQTMTSQINIANDGSVTGEMTVHLTGDPAADAREGWRRVSKESEEKWLQDIFNADGNEGSGTMTKDDPKPLLNTFNYTIKFNKKDFIQADSAGGLYVNPIVPTHYSISNLTYIGGKEGDPVEMVCSSAFSEEEYTYTFAPNFKILDIPTNKTIEGSYVSYKSTYQLDGNVLHVKRMLDDKTPGIVCAPDLIKAQRELILKINRNLKAQIIYKPILEE